MRRSTITMLAAAAAAALAAAAVVALPAIGDPGTTGTDHTPDFGDFAACLAKHGLPGAPTAGRELKRWLVGKEDQDPRAVRAAIDACPPSAPRPSAPGPDAVTIITCLRSHGIDAPTRPADFKRWLGERQQAGPSKALDDAIAACKLALAPQSRPANPGKPDCGAPTDKPPAAKPETPRDTNAA